MSSPDISQLTANKFVELGGQVFGKKVMEWNLRELGVEVRVNVKAPQALTKLSATGGPRPYSAGDNTDGNGVAFSDRVLTAFLSKWDHDFDPEKFRNTYLAKAANDDTPFYMAATQQLAKEYLEKIYSNTLYLGVRDANGDAAVDICDGWGTILAALILANDIDPVATGAITAANAVEKIDLQFDSASDYLKKQEGLMYCSRTIFRHYAKRYRELYNQRADLVSDNQIRIDNTKTLLTVADFMGNSGRLIHTLPGNLVFGTDVESIKVAATVRRNIIEARPMMSAGCEFQDLDVLSTNDVA